MPLTYALISWAFLAGVVSFLNPCGIAMLPAYISYYFERRERNKSLVKRILSALVLGLFVSLGFLVVFASFGLIFASLGRQLAAYVPYLAAAIGFLLVIVGISMLLNKGISFGIAKLDIIGNKLKSNMDGSYKSFFLYGIGYAIASLGCTMPVFLAVVAGSFSTGGFTDGVAMFLLYTLGMSLFMIAVSIATAVSKGMVIKYINKGMPYIKKIGAIVIIGAGLYIMYYQLILGGIAGI